MLYNAEDIQTLQSLQIMFKFKYLYYARKRLPLSCQFWLKCDGLVCMQYNLYAQILQTLQGCIFHIFTTLKNQTLQFF